MPQDANMSSNFYEAIAIAIAKEITENLTADISALRDGEGAPISGNIDFS